ncbi:hypothetical protein [Natronorubrum sp. FCH18a]|uniref:hypothetical protein n=1 Tax=Natronorubrum sp. FCH18a TaxID=3447018 RepID=UPI003F513329
MSKPSTARDPADTEPTDDEQRGDREPFDEWDSGDRRSETDGWALEDVAPSLAKPIRVTGFWGAIVLPVFYVPLLANGLSTALEALLFCGLIALNLVALYVGHAHRR